jgi:uncharacterized membrane protein YcaP (DUF421 family)
MLVLIFRVLITYAVVLRVFRMMGKRQLSELQPFELVVSILIADIASQPLLDVNIPMLTSFIAIVLLALLQVAISYISLYSRGSGASSPAIPSHHHQGRANRPAKGARHAAFNG